MIEVNTSDLTLTDELITILSSSIFWLQALVVLATSIVVARLLSRSTPHLSRLARTLVSGLATIALLFAMLTVIAWDQIDFSTLESGLLDPRTIFSFASWLGIGLIAAWLVAGRSRGTGRAQTSEIFE